MVWVSDCEGLAGLLLTILKILCQKLPSKIFSPTNLFCVLYSCKQQGASAGQKSRTVVEALRPKLKVLQVIIMLISSNQYLESTNEEVD